MSCSSRAYRWWCSLYRGLLNSQRKLLEGQSEGGVGGRCELEPLEPRVMLSASGLLLDALAVNPGVALIGTPAAEELVGGSGDDVLIGNGGADVLIGGGGDDVLAVLDDGFARVEGGSGFDTLRIDGVNAVLNLTMISNDRITGIEAIDLRGAANNGSDFDTLILNVDEVLGLSDTSDTLVVRRDADDTVHLGSGWTLLGSEVVGGEKFDVYQQGAATLKIQQQVASVVGRHAFYNHSAWDGNNGLLTVSDDMAIATDKAALLPGQTATFANYTSYSLGLNGVMVDVSRMANPSALLATDFELRVGNSADPSAWATAPVPTTVAVRAGAGVGGSYRIAIAWSDNAIQNQWLQVKVKPTANTGLIAEDVFYFGNAIGETGNDPANAFVNAFDAGLVRDHFQSSFPIPAGIDNPYDINRDMQVNAFDLGLVRDHFAGFGSALNLFTAPSTGGTVAATSMGTSSTSPALSPAAGSVDDGPFVLPPDMELLLAGWRLRESGRGVPGVPAATGAIRIDLDRVLRAPGVGWRLLDIEMGHPDWVAMGGVSTEGVG